LCLRSSRLSFPQDSAIHPDTGDLVFRGFRFSAFVPVNIPLVVGMLSSSTPAGTIFWQWANQSYNVAVNYANRNIGKDEMTTQDIATSYAGAVISSCSIALGLGKVVDHLNKTPNPVSPMQGAQACIAHMEASECNMLARSRVTFVHLSLVPSSFVLRPCVQGLGIRVFRGAVPFVAVASAGVLNVVLMRRGEMQRGISVKDSEGVDRGTSVAAGVKAITEVALTRVALPAPILLFPPFIMSVWDRLSFAQQRPKWRPIVQVPVITACLWLALPLAIGLFPQQSSIAANKLEPQFQNMKDSKGNKIDTFYFNKGL
jgi:hypothetical protein